MIITEEIYLPLNNKNFTEDLLENILEPKGTVELAVNGKYSEVEKKEGKTNAYALENLYRRELLKKSEGYTSDNIASANRNIKKAKEMLKNNRR